MYKIILRSASIEDADAIAQVYLRSRKELVAFAPLIHSDENVYHWIRHTLLLEEQVIVAEERSRIIGMMSLTKPNETGCITQLYIHPEVVGKGIGALLLDKAKAILGPPIHLHTFQQNQGAIRFYEKHGFTIIGFDDGSGNEEKCAAFLYEWNSKQKD